MQLAGIAFSLPVLLSELLSMIAFCIRSTIQEVKRGFYLSVLCNISQLTGNTITVLQCTPTGNCGAKDLQEITLVPHLQLARKERLKKAHSMRLQ